MFAGVPGLITGVVMGGVMGIPVVGGAIGTVMAGGTWLLTGGGTSKGVVTGFVGGVVRGFVAGFSGVSLKGFVDGTVTMFGIGVSWGIVFGDCGLIVSCSVAEISFLWSSLCED